MKSSSSNPTSNGAASERSRVLIIEDDTRLRQDLQSLLSKEPNLDATAVSDPEQACRLLEEQPFDVAIADLRLPRLDGLEVIRQVQEKRLPVTLIVLPASGGIDEAVQAVRLIASDFLTRPIDMPRLRQVLDRALRDRDLQEELTRLREQLQRRYCYHDVLSRSPRMHTIFELINQVASTTTTVLIEGETGTGKEQIARALHHASASVRKGAFVAVNCAAVPENLLESELFGHEKGSFTGAIGQRKGRFEQADGGTLFLDEVGDIPASMQVKLLRVLQERTFERVGGGSPIEVDVRIIAATNRDLRKMVKKGQFREDLYYRLDVVRIEVPPLRERPEDIDILAIHFARKHSLSEKPVATVSDAALESLRAHAWPGNVRELENVIERACVTAQGSAIEPGDLPNLSGSTRTGSGVEIDLHKPLRQLLDEIISNVEREYLVKALRKTRGHVGKAARLCGYSRRSITGKLAEHHIDRGEFTDS